MLSSKSLKRNAPEAAHRGAPGAGSGRSAWHAGAGPRRRLIALSTTRGCPDTGGAQHASRAPRVCGHHLLPSPGHPPQRTRDVYYQSHALPLQTNHQHKKPTSPPTTAITATDMPAMAPEERLGPPLLAAPPVTRWQRTGPLLLGGAAQFRQPLTLPLLDSQDAHVLPERSVQRDGAQTRCTVPQVGLREAGGSRSGTARCGGGSGDRRPSKTNHRPLCGGCLKAVYR